VSFIGPSASGKTTLLNLLGALDRPTSGRRASASARTSAQWNQQLLVDAAFRHNMWSANARAVLDVDKGERWTARGTSYEAYLSFKPLPSFTLDIGKTRQNWGKGYVWSPVAFVDRPKNPDDPSRAQEGFIVASADYIRSFDGPLQTLSITPVLLPVYEGVNESFGRTGRLNGAGKLYLLFHDTDIDLVLLGGGSRTNRLGMDVSRNIVSNLEIHGEVALIPSYTSTAVTQIGQTSERVQRVTNWLAGLRYLTPSEVTIIAEYYHAGTGLTPAAMRDFFGFATAAYDEYAASGNASPLQQAAKLAALGYGGPTPMRNYVYVRASKPDAFGVLYLTPAAYTLVNTDDRSFSLTQEIQYTLVTNLELRSQVSVIGGRRGTDFGERRADWRAELRARYYF
jgi:energy-coupling factor transporter ATP-binding protein EcfA2